MKKLFLFAAVATMLAACTTDTTEDVAVNCLPYDVLHVSVGDEDESRIQLDGNSRIVWNEGDKVSVFNKTNGNECWQFDGKTGDRSGTLSKVSGNAGLISTDKVIALYPYDPKCVVSGNMISTTIPATQTYRADSFGRGGNIMVAVSDDDNLHFNNIFGWIRLSLTDDKEQTVHSISLMGNDNEKLTGNIVIDTGSQKMYMNGNNTSTIILDCSEGVQLSKTKPTYFYIALAPQTFAKGVSINVIMTNGTSLEQHYEDPFTVTRNHIQPIKVSNFQTINDKIVYATTNGKPVAMETNDGFGANIISNTYENGQGIIQFDGDITSIPKNAFNHCKTLKGILIPYSVTSIGNYAFYDCSSLTSVTIGGSVTSIGNYAFYDCSSLTSVTIGGSVTSIGNSAFLSCKGLTSVNITDIAKWCAIEFKDSSSNPLYYAHNLYLNGKLVTDLVIPDGVTSIGDWAFYDCSSLTSVTIGGSVTSIGDRAFSYCRSLTSVTIGDSVTSIGDNAFYYCSSLTSVHITDIAKWCAIKFENVNSNPLNFAHNLYLNGELVTDLVIPDSVTSIGDRAFYDCSSLTSVTIGGSVTSIGDRAFSYCRSLTSVTIGDSVTSIGDNAFYYCESLKFIVISDGVTSIGSSAFDNCYNLNAVYITDIAKWCAIKFDGNCCANPLWHAHNLYLNGELVTDLVIPGSVTSIGDWAFYNCDSLTSVTIGDSVTSIGDNAFYYCSSLTSVTIGNSVTSIGDSAFSNCGKLTSITIPDSVTSIGDGAFMACRNLLLFLGKYSSSDFRCLIMDGELIAFAPFGLTEYIIPDGVTSIGDWAFYDCSSLTSVTIGGSVTSIGDNAFSYCRSLTSVTIPNSVTSIGHFAFWWCDRLESIYCKPTIPPTLGDGAIPNYATIYVPTSSVGAYKSASGWSSYASKITGYDF